MKKKVAKNHILTLLLLVSILSGYSLVSADQVTSKENGHSIKVKSYNAPEKRVKKEAGRRNVKKLMIGTVISVSLAGILFVYLFLPKMGFFEEEGERDEDPTLELPEQGSNVDDKDKGIEESHEGKRDRVPTLELPEQGSNVDGNDKGMEESHEGEEENRQGEERVKKLKERLKKEGERIAKNFPYRFEDYPITQYDLTDYHGKNVAPNGNCWLYTSWVAYFHILNHCKEGYEDFPKIMEELRSEVEGFKSRYQKWANSLNKAVKELKDPMQQESYLMTYRAVIRYYSSAFEHHKALFEKELKKAANMDDKKRENFYETLIINMDDDVPYQGIDSDISVDLREKAEQVTKKVCKAVWRRMKQPWMKRISWFPEMHEFHLLGYQEDGLDKIASIIEAVDDELHKKGKESGIAYIRERIVKRYLKGVEKIIERLQEFLDITPLLVVTLQEAHQYQHSLELQLKWLEQHPEKLALLLRFTRLKKFIIDIQPNGSNLLRFHKKFEIDLQDGTYGITGAGVLLRLGLGFTLEKEEKMDDKVKEIYSLYYRKGKEKKKVEGLIAIREEYIKEEDQLYNHAHYAVTRKVWKGK